MLCKIHRLIFAATSFLICLVRHNNNNFTMLENHSAEDVIKVSFEELNEEQNKLVVVEANRDAFTKLSLESFNNGKVIQKSALPTPSVTVTPIDPLARTSSAVNFQDAVKTTLHHALINQSGVLVNTLANMIQQIAGGLPIQQKGHAYY